MTNIHSVRLGPGRVIYETSKGFEVVEHRTLDRYRDSAAAVVEDIEEFSKGLERVTVNAEVEHSYGDEFASIELQGYRPATSQEIEVFNTRNNAAKEEREKADREAYEKLKAKFGGSE